MVEGEESIIAGLREVICLEMDDVYMVFDFA